LQVSYPISEGTEGGALGNEARHFLKHRKETMSKQYRAYDWLDWFAVLLPAVAWLRKYNFRRHLLVRIRHPCLVCTLCSNLVQHRCPGCDSRCAYA
jgi:hypothetical protein